LALYFKRKDQFLDTANKGEIDWQEEEKKDCKFKKKLPIQSFLYIKAKK